MRRSTSLATALLAAAMLLAGCASGAPAGGGSSSNATTANQGPKTLRIALQGAWEPKEGLFGYGAPGGFDGLEHFLVFHASLMVHEPDGNLAPRLAQKLPSLQDGDWRTFPDGRMEVTWKLQPNATWHDGRPLTSQDFLLGWRILNDPDVPASRPTYARLVSSIEAPDANTLVMHWREPSFQAGGTGTGFLLAHAAHILTQPFETSDKQAFLNHPYWTTEFVGLGPYKFNRWERGSFTEGLAFDGYVHGRPRIDRVLIMYVGDANVVAAGMMSGDLDLIPMGARLDVNTMMAIQNGWGPNGGTAFVVPFGVRTVYLQFRDPNAPWARDVRVRRALVHITDRQGLSDALQEGLTPPADTFVPKEDAVFRILEQRGFARYPFDVRRGHALLAEAGWTVGSDGSARDSSGTPLTMDLSATGQGGNVDEIVSLASMWTTNGVRSQPVPLPPQSANLDELKNIVKGGFVWPGISLSTPSTLRSDNIAHDRNAWRGGNYGGYVNPEYDALYDKFVGTLEVAPRQQVHADIMSLVADQVPVIPIYYYGNIMAIRRGVEGPAMISPLQTASSWDIHRWDLR